MGSRPNRSGSCVSGGPAWRDELAAYLASDSRYGSLGTGTTRTPWACWPLSDHRNLYPPGRWSFRPAAITYFSSGTTGTPKPISYGEQDWQDTVGHRADLLRGVGVRGGDTVAVVLPFGPWFSGDNITDALVALGARVLPAGMYAPHLPAIARLVGWTGADTRDYP